MMNLKVLYSFILFFVFSISSFANVLSPKEALQRAFTENRLSPFKVSLIQAAEIPAIYTWNDKYGKPTMYLFRTKGEINGFVLVSAEDKAYALLGYSDKNYLKPVSTAPVFIKFIGNLEVFKEYTEQIEWIRYKNLNSSDLPELLHLKDYPQILPKIQTHWNQREPYYDDCPLVGGERCLTGCTPTAFSQVMKYYSWPKRGVSSHSYSPFPGRTLSLDFSQLTFNWPQMINNYTNTATAAQKKAVAEIMYAAGVAMNTKYGPSASGASIEAGAMALYKFFKYQKSIKVVKRKFYTVYEWYDLLYNELKNNGPIIYSLPSHTFICDGYAGKFFHFNWGWGGDLDGFFYTTAIKYNYTPTHANYSHNILTGISPDDGRRQINVTPYIEGDDFQLPVNSVPLGRNFDVIGPFSNGTVNTIDFYFGLKATGSDNKTIYLQGQQECNLQPNYHYSKFYIKIPVGTAPGIYSITPVIKTGSGWHDINLNPSNSRILYMVIKNSKANFFKKLNDAKRFYSS